MLKSSLPSCIFSDFCLGPVFFSNTKAVASVGGGGRAGFKAGEIVAIPISVLIWGDG